MLYKRQPLGCGEIQLSGATTEEIRAAYAQADEDAEIRTVTRYEYCQIDQASIWFAMRSQNRIVGEVYLHDLDLSEKSTMFGIFLFREIDRGHGLGRQALRALIDYCFGTLNLELIELGTSPHNLRAVRCYAAVGFHLLGPALERSGEIIMELWRPLPTGEKRVSAWVT